MLPNHNLYPLVSERQYCSLPDDCLSPDVLFIGSAIGLACPHFMYQAL